MGFLEILAWARKIQHRLHECAESIRNAEQRKRNQQLPPDEPIEVRGTIALDQKTMADFAAQNQSNNPTQQSIKNATWAAFYAVAAYGVVTVFMWCSMMEQNRLTRINIQQADIQWNAQNRPWVGNGEIGFKQPPVLLVYPKNPVFGRTQINFAPDIPIKNVGSAPAFHVYTYFVATVTKEISAPPNLDTMMGTACKGADSTAKNIGGVLFPNSPETREGWPEGLGIPLQAAEVHRVWINICVAYSGRSSGEQPHHTKIWMASWPINEQPREISRTANPDVIYYSLPIPKWGVIKTEAD
jgi:hypothetical protein